MGWSKDPGPTYLAGRLPAIFVRGGMKELSIFIDESGDFGEYAKHSPYYIITMVMHDQAVDISAEITKLNDSLNYMGYGDEQAIHTEPLIRREEPYKFFEPNERRALFSKLFYFAMACDIKYKSFIYRKTEYEIALKLSERMERDITGFIIDNYAYFQSFERVILYYDNGQHELSSILNKVFSAQLVNYDMRRVFPNQYKLFQVADLICTLELLRVKTEHQDLSNSEKKIFHSKRDLKKDFMKGIRKKEFT